MKKSKQGKTKEEVRAPKFNVYERAGKFYCDFQVDGRRTRRVLAALSVTEARKEALLLRSREIEIARGLRPPEPKRCRDAFSAFADEFLETYSRPNKRSWKRDEESLKVLKRHFKGDLQEIGSEDVARFMAKRKAEVSEKRGTLISPATVNRELACLKTLFNIAVEWGRVKSSPTERVKKFREPEYQFRILTPEDSDKLLDAANPALRSVVLLALNTAMRSGEIKSLQWADVDLTKGFVSIKTSKSGRSRKVPMSGPVFDMLRDMKGGHKPEEFVFANPKTRTRFVDFKTGFLSACRRAEIKEVRFHDLRHTAISRMVEAGVDLVTVAKIAGHSDIKMTVRYCHPTEQSMRAAVGTLGEYFKKPRQEKAAQVATRDVTLKTASLASGSKQDN